MGGERGDGTGSESSDLPSFADWFRGLPGREIFVPVPLYFIEDEFNLYDVHSMPSFETVLELVLADEPPEDEVLRDAGLREELIRFYELVHQKYILTKAGLHDMYGKFARGEFGKCPRALCNGEFVLPLGQYTQPGKGTLRLYCPHCQDIYVPPSRRQARLDGCGFGPSFAHCLILQYRERLPSWSHCRHQWTRYEPTIFGFRIHKSSSMAPRSSPLLRRAPDGYR